MSKLSAWGLTLITCTLMLCVRPVQGAQEHEKNTPRVTALIEKFDGGKFQMKIVGHGRDPRKGSYWVTYNLVGYASKGVALSSEIQEFSEHWRCQSGQQWSSHGNPLGGYLYFFREGGRDKVNIRLLSRWHPDSHKRRPQKENINGVYSVTGTNLERIYNVHVRLGRKESWLENRQAGNWAAGATARKVREALFVAILLQRETPALTFEDASWKLALLLS